MSSLILNLFSANCVLKKAIKLYLFILYLYFLVLIAVLTKTLLKRVMLGLTFEA